MNLFDLFVKIGVDDQASGKIDEIKDKLGGVAEKLGNGLKVAAEVGIAAIGAASAAIGALAKLSIDQYAEYEQLVGGAETLFKGSADKVIEYAAGAYQTAGMSANEYLSTVTSFSASLIQSLASATDDAETQTVESVEAAREEQLEILEKTSEESVELLKEAQEEEVDAFEKATDEKIALIDEQYRENMKLIDEERYNQLKAIDDQIAALNAQTEAERAAIAERDHQRKLSELQARIDAAETAEERAKAQEKLNDYLADYEQKRVEAARKAEIEILQDQKDAIKEQAKAQEEAAKEARDAAVKAVKDSSAEQLKELKKAQDAQMKQLKASNKEKLAEASKYYDELLKSLETAEGAAEATAETYAAAADVANMAIVDMSDNANKMGTDMSLIQNAYQGFAKANYTMLDNLKLGYGGTKTEMERLIADANRVKEANGEMADLSIDSFADVVEAIHIVQTEMGITGTTAKEAGSTISGSAASMKAAWANLLTGIADENADFETLVDNFITTLVGDGTEANKGFFGNILPRVKTTLSGIGDLVKGLAPIIAEVLPELVEEAGPPILGAAADMIQSFLDSLVSLTSGDKSGDIKDSGGGLLLKVVDGIAERSPDMLDSAAQIISNLVNGLTSETGKESGNKLMIAAGKILKALGNFIVKIAPELLYASVEIISNIIDFFLDENNQAKIKEGAVEIFNTLKNSLGAKDWAGVGADIILGIADGLWAALTVLPEGMLKLLGIDTNLTTTWRDMRSGGVDLEASAAFAPYSPSAGGFSVDYPNSAGMMYNTGNPVVDEYLAGMNVTVNQTIVNPSQTAADLMEEAMYQAREAAVTNVQR